MICLRQNLQGGVRLRSGDRVPEWVNLLEDSVSHLAAAETRALGVRRLSLGGAMAKGGSEWVSIDSRALIENGTFGGCASALTDGDLNALFRASPAVVPESDGTRATHPLAHGGRGCRRPDVHGVTDSQAPGSRRIATALMFGPRAGCRS